MSYSNSTSTKTTDGNKTESQEAASSDTPDTGGEAMQFEGELNQLLEQAEDWIRDNQKMAMLGGFGLGVFIGVLLRR